MHDVAHAYYCRAYNDREKEFWKAASESEDPWLPLEALLMPVLVPYIAVQLIREEMSISLEEASDVYKQSKAFGTEHNSDLNAEKFSLIYTMLCKYYGIQDDKCDSVRSFINRFKCSTELYILQQPAPESPRVASSPEPSQNAPSTNERPRVKLTVSFVFSMYPIWLRNSNSDSSPTTRT